MAGLVPAIHVFRSLPLSLRPIRAAGYSEPWIDMHNRIKEALVLLGRLSRPSSPAAGETFGPHDHLNARRCRRPDCWGGEAGRDAAQFFVGRTSGAYPAISAQRE
jgi:hypothetical protein